MQDPERVVEGFTEEFEEGFMELLRRSHPHSRVAAKIVYNDYISDACVPSPLAIASLGVPNTNYYLHFWVSGFLPIVKFLPLLQRES